MRQRIAVGATVPQALGEDDQLLPHRKGLLAPGRRRRGKKYLLPLALLVIVGLGLSYHLVDLSKRLYTKGRQPEESLVSNELNLNLPSVDEAEQNLPPAAQRGKEFLVKALQKAEEAREQAGDPRPSTEAKEALTVLAKHVSGGKTEDLIGQTIVLDNTRPLDESIRIGNVRRLTVTKFLGEGASKLLLEVLDEQTGDKFTLLIPFIVNIMQEEEEGSTGGAKELESPSQAFNRLSERTQWGIKCEERGIRRALGRTSAAQLASRRGIAVPLCTARISGIQDGLFSGNVFVSGSVQLMERLHGDLWGLVDAADNIPMDAKEYIASRLMLQLLHLQEVGLCHHDINLHICHMRSDGTFLVGDLGSSAPVGKPVDVMSETTPAYTDPRLIMDIINALKTGDDVKAHLSSDLWSYGAVIYELFTDQLPYGLMDVADDFQVLQQWVSNLIENGGSQDKLISEMKDAGVPDRWQNLLLRLLEVDRAKRITAKEVAAEFSDLFYQ